MKVIWGFEHCCVLRFEHWKNVSHKLILYLLTYLLEPVRLVIEKHDVGWFGCIECKDSANWVKQCHSGVCFVWVSRVLHLAWNIIAHFDYESLQAITCASANKQKQIKYGTINRHKKMQKTQEPLVSQATSIMEVTMCYLPCYLPWGQVHQACMAIGLLPWYPYWGCWNWSQVTSEEDSILWCQGGYDKF